MHAADERIAEQRRPTDIHPTHDVFPTMMNAADDHDDPPSRTPPSFPALGEAQPTTQEEGVPPCGAGKVCRSTPYSPERRGGSGPRGLPQQSGHRYRPRSSLQAGIEPRGPCGIRLSLRGSLGRVGVFQLKLVVKLGVSYFGESQVGAICTPGGRDRPYVAVFAACAAHCYRVGPSLLRRPIVAELDVRPSPANPSYAPADCRAAIVATIRSASAPTRPIEVERGSTTLIPAK